MQKDEFIATVKQKRPDGLKPMLATLTETMPSEGQWIYEIKLDGYRALAFCDGNKVNLHSRNNKSFNEKFYPIMENLKRLKLHAILDGEIVVINEKGIASFEGLQDWRSEQVCIYTFR